jgi:CheY-like chemotaxis protein
MSRSPANRGDAETRRSARSHSEVHEKVVDPAAPARRLCVLVAEDEDMVRELAMNVLDAHGFDTIGARHGGEALQLFHEHLPEIDAVLLDLSMPVLDGMRVLDELRRQKPSLPVVVTSGYDDTPADVDSPSVSFLSKPYRAEHLITRLRSLLADQAALTGGDGDASQS